MLRIVVTGEPAVVSWGLHELRVLRWQAGLLQASWGGRYRAALRLFPVRSDREVRHRKKSRLQASFF